MDPLRSFRGYTRGSADLELRGKNKVRVLRPATIGTSAAKAGVMGKPSHRRAGFTLPELLVLLGVCASVAAIFVISLSYQTSPRPPKCANNLKNIGLAFRIFATDNNDLFPFQIEGPLGTKSLNRRDDAFKQFLALSNEISTPTIVLCPQDPQKIRAEHWTHFSNANVSYFVGMTAIASEPQSILSGDRNLLVNGSRSSSGLLSITSARAVSFSKTMHDGAGNICFADGSVQQLSSARLQEAIRSSRGGTNQFLFP
jgi:prepilin-type processing-associated H-X9-DG protein